MYKSLYYSYYYNIIIINLYSAVSQSDERINVLLTLLPLVTGPYISFLKPSQLPVFWEYTPGTVSTALQANYSHKPTCPHRYPCISCSSMNLLNLKQICFIRQNGNKKQMELLRARQDELSNKEDSLSGKTL